MPIHPIINTPLNSKRLKDDVFLQIGDDKQNEFPYFSISTKEIMLSYANDPNTSLSSAQILWQEMLTDAICLLKFNDTRERLYKDSCEKYLENKKSFLESFDQIRKMSSYGIDKIGDYFKDFVKYENVLYGTDDFYRDHVNHLLQVWALGIGLLFSENSQYKNLIFSDGVELLDKEFHFLTNVKVPDTTKRISIGEIWAMWTIIALTHDLGYPIEKTSKINQIARKITSYFGCLNFEELNYNFGIFNTFIVEKFLNIISSKVDEKHTTIQSKYRDKLSKSLEDFQHGIFSSLLVFKSLTYFLETDFSYDKNELDDEDLRQFHIRKEILRTIAGHTCPKLYHVRINTLPFLLILCDELQEWDRPHFDDIKTGTCDRVKVKIKVCNFLSDPQEISIEFNYEEEDLGNINKIKNYLVKHRFQPMHYLLRSAPHDDKRKIKFLWTINFSDNTYFEFRFDTTQNSFNMTMIEEYKIDKKVGKPELIKTIDLFNYKSENDPPKNP